MTSNAPRSAFSICILSLHALYQGQKLFKISPLKENARGSNHHSLLYHDGRTSLHVRQKEIRGQRARCFKHYETRAVSILWLQKRNQGVLAHWLFTSKRGPLAQVLREFNNSEIRIKDKNYKQGS